MSKKIKVLFTGKNLRQRRKETVLNPPEGIEFVTERSLDNMAFDYQLVKKKKLLKQKFSNGLQDC